MADPARADELDDARRALRRGRRRASTSSAATGSRRARARSSPASAFADEVVDDDVGELSGGWKMRVGARADPAHAARRAAARRADQPPRHRVDPLARAFPARLRGRARDDLARSRVPEPPGHEDRRDRRRRAHHLLRATTTSTSASATSRRASSEAQYARQQAMLAKEQAFIERFKARASHAAQVQSRVKKLEKIEKVEPPRRRQRDRVRVPHPAALGRRRRQARAASPRATAEARSTGASIC